MCQSRRLESSGPFDDLRPREAGLVERQSCKGAQGFDFPEHTEPAPREATCGLLPALEPQHAVGVPEQERIHEDVGQAAVAQLEPADDPLETAHGGRRIDLAREETLT